jgi:hypothetical protein
MLGTSAIGGLDWWRRGATATKLNRAIWLFGLCLAATIGNPESSCLPHRQLCFGDATGVNDFLHGIRLRSVSAVRNEATTATPPQWQRRDGHLLVVSPHRCAFSVLTVGASVLSPICLTPERGGLRLMPPRGVLPVASSTRNTRHNFASSKCARSRAWSVNLHMKRSNKAKFGLASTAVSDDKDRDISMDLGKGGVAEEEMVLMPKPVRRELQQLAPSAFARDRAGLSSSANANATMIKPSNFRQARSIMNMGNGNGTVKVKVLIRRNGQGQGQGSTSCPDEPHTRRNPSYAHKIDQSSSNNRIENMSSRGKMGGVDKSSDGVFKSAIWAWYVFSCPSIHHHQSAAVRLFLLPLIIIRVRLCMQ